VIFPTVKLACPNLFKPAYRDSAFFPPSFDSVYRQQVFEIMTKCEEKIVLVVEPYFCKPRVNDEGKMPGKAVRNPMAKVEQIVRLRRQ
jgi:hypothetical protein